MEESHFFFPGKNSESEAIEGPQKPDCGEPLGVSDEAQEALERALGMGRFAPPPFHLQARQRLVWILLRFWCPYAVIELFSSCLDWIAHGLFCFCFSFFLPEN